MIVELFPPKKSSNYTYDRHVIVYTDHKPLTAIVQKNIAQMLHTLQQMLLIVDWYLSILLYKQDPTMHNADLLSKSGHWEEPVTGLDVNVQISEMIPLSRS